jgi:hypothetical protein
VQGKPKSRAVCPILRFPRLSHEGSELPYTWKQELGELDLVVPVPKGTRGKNLSVVIAKKRLTVGLKGQAPILDGELCKEIKMEDSTWTIRQY